MNPQRLSGILLLLAGVMLFVLGMSATESMADQWSNFFTGHFTDKTVWYIVGGLASAAMGLLMLSLGGRPTTA